MPQRAYLMFLNVKEEQTNGRLAYLHNLPPNFLPNQHKIIKFLPNFIKDFFLCNFQIPFFLVRSWRSPPPSPILIPHCYTLQNHHRCLRVCIRGASGSPAILGSRHEATRRHQSHRSSQRWMIGREKRKRGVR